MTAEEAAWMAWRDDPRPLGWFIPRDERAFKDGYRAARAEAFAEIRRGVEGLERWRGATDGHSAWMTLDLDGDWFARSAVLALLPSVPPEET